MYRCVLVGDHKNVGKTIEECKENGWHLYTYARARIGAIIAVNHWLLEREE